MVKLLKIDLRASQGYPLIILSWIGARAGWKGRVEWKKPALVIRAKPIHHKSRVCLLLFSSLHFLVYSVQVYCPLLDILIRLFLHQ